MAHMNMKVVASLILVATVANAFTTTTTRQSLVTLNESRRNFIATVAATTAAVIASPPVHASTGLKKVNAELQAYGLPLVKAVPDGLTPLVELYGKGANRFPILVNFCYPLSWIVTLPSNNVNGEDGTVQAGDYNKGDTATFFVYNEPGHVDNLGNNKALIEEALQKCISQKGNNMYQNFKVTKTVPGPVDGYTVADFKYQLLTGAGFEVDRKGVASLTSQGPAVEVLWTASTTIRYKKTEPMLRDIVSTFRCYTDGLQLSTELQG